MTALAMIAAGLGLWYWYNYDKGYRDGMELMRILHEKDGQGGGR